MATQQGSLAIAWLSPDDRFDMLEVADKLAWGVATGPGLVGYVDCDALETRE